MLLLRFSDLMLSVLLRSMMAPSAETTQQAHHVVIMFRRRRTAVENPIEKIGVGAIEQRFEPVKLDPVQALEVLLGKRAEDQVALLRPAMPAPEKQPPAADIEMFALGCTGKKLAHSALILSFAPRFSTSAKALAQIANFGLRRLFVLKGPSRNPPHGGTQSHSGELSSAAQSVKTGN